MGTVRLENIEKIYPNGFQAVEKSNLEIHEGEFLVLLGPSGCGKTTIMRMIVGLEEVTKGKVFIGSEEVTETPVQKRNVGMVFQNYAVWPHMTVYENIAFPLKLKGFSKKKIKDQINKVSEMTNITDYLDRYPTQLSGGQRQRVAVARAVAYQPKVFLMDEPLSALDAKLRESMRTELKQIQRQLKATTVFVTHDQAEAMSLADRIVVMDKGKIIQIGSPEEVYHDCNNLFIADFIGTPPTNFIDVKIIKKNNDITVKHSDFEFNLKSADYKTLERYIDKDVILGIRPEDMEISKTESGSLKLNLLLTEPQGNYKIVVCVLAERKIKIVVPSDVKIPKSKTIPINFKLDRIMLFDKETEERIR
ncbi:MAG TPA: ABC transporter ATP-binding protein [Victivallales bacterium]|nr:ABC transporter ATP-binding protein [Victivallales bacterium]